MNLRLDISYNGAPFHGFARQPDVRTVQGDIESALSKLLGYAPITYGAGRTDAGVHALGQVMSVHDVPADLDLDKIKDSLNGMCAPFIAVNSCRLVDDQWHARFSARSRTYVYAVLEAAVPDPFLATTTLWHSNPLDLDAMVEASGHLLGPRDFSSFGRVPEPGATAERNLFELSCERGDRILRITARANAFIQQMVRSIVGTLVQVGEGRRSPDDIPSILNARDRSAAGPVALPHGLCLVAVEYDDGWSTPAAAVALARDGSV
ncbi:MAG: tRNA pseudouridine(38-40) synthase TruA [Actinomycetota bacterium]